LLFMLRVIPLVATIDKGRSTSPDGSNVDTNWARVERFAVVRTIDDRRCLGMFRERMRRASVGERIMMFWSERTGPPPCSSPQFSDRKTDQLADFRRPFRNRS